MEHLRPERHSSPRRKRLFATLGVVVTAGAAFTAGSLITHRNNREANQVAIAARTLATERNTCAIKSVKLEPITPSKKQSLKVTISLASEVEPSTLNKQYDGIGMDATFSDETGNLVSGVAVINETHKGELHGGMLSGNSNEGPDDPINTVIVAEPLLTPDRSTYRVFRQNAVDSRVTGPLVSDIYPLQVGVVSCGSFVYRPGYKPVIQ